MTVINDDEIGIEYWCTTEQVRDRFQIEVGNEQPDHESQIVEATDMLQARVASATGLPQVTDNSDTGGVLGNDDGFTLGGSTGGTVSVETEPGRGVVPPLLQYATAYKAASLAHLKFAVNVQSENDGDQRPAFLNTQADEMFSRWKDRNDLNAESERENEASESVSGVSGVMGGDSRSPIQRSDTYNGDHYGGH